jgi:dipeptidase E
MATIIAIGGEEIGELSSDGRLKPILTQKIHKEIIARAGKDNPSVLYIPTAKDDSEAYIAAFRKYYLSLGCSDVDVLRLIRKEPSHIEVAEKILSADIIYVNGGNTHRMMRIWKRRGVIDLLIEAHQKGVIMAGHSAGAICWFSAGNSDSFNRRRPFKAKAIGIVDALLCPHYDTESSRRSSLKRMMKRTPRIVAIALDECTAIEIIDDTYRILSSTPTSKARKAFWRKGRYYIEDIPAGEGINSLSSLLTKQKHKNG